MIQFWFGFCIAFIQLNFYTTTSVNMKEIPKNIGIRLDLHDYVKNNWLPWNVHWFQQERLCTNSNHDWCCLIVGFIVVPFWRGRVEGRCWDPASGPLSLVMLALLVALGWSAASWPWGTAACSASRMSLQRTPAYLQQCIWC